MSKFTSKAYILTVIKDNLLDHLIKHKKQYILFGILLISAFVVGLIAVFAHSNIKSIEGISDIVIKRYLNKDISLGGLFVSRLLSIIGVCILIWLFSSNKWLSFVNVLILTYLAFIFGSTCAALMVLFKLSGFITSIVVYLPCHIMFLFCMLTLVVVCQGYIFDRCNYRGEILSLDFYYVIRKTLFVVLILCFITCIVEVALLPIFSSALIMGVS